MSDEILKFEHPSNIMVAGPTNSEKTQLVVHCLKHEMFEIVQTDLIEDVSQRKFPERLIWIYASKQKLYNHVRDEIFPDVEFTTDFDILQTLDYSKINLVILDDKRITKLFLSRYHHQNTSVIYIVQNLFAKGSESRDISLNTQYFVIMKSNRNMDQVKTLGGQIFGSGTGKEIAAIYEDATIEPYTHLLIDNHISTPNEFRLRSGIFPGQHNNVYVLSKDLKYLGSEIV